MPNRPTFYAEDLANTTNSTTTFQDKVSVTFTPKANKDYFIIASAIQGQSTNTTAYSEHQLWDANASAQLAASRCGIPYNTAERPGWFAIYKWTAPASPVPQTFKIRFRSSAAGSVANSQYATLLVLESHPDDAYGSLDTATATSSTNVTRATLTVTPATNGDYLIIGFAEHANSNLLPGGGYVRLTDGTNIWGECDLDPQTGSSTHYQPWGTIVKRTVTTAGTTFNVRFASNGAVTVGHRNSRILALRLDKFDNSYYAENRPVASSTSTTYQDMVTLTTTPLNRVHLVLACGINHMNSASYQSYFNFIEGATQMHEGNTQRDNFSGAPYQTPYLSVYRKLLPNASTTWKTQYKSGNASGNASIRESAIAVLQTQAPEPQFNRFVCTSM